MLTIISTIASIVSIIGGIVGIWSAFRPRPIYQVPQSPAPQSTPQVAGQPAVPRSGAPFGVAKSPAPGGLRFGLLVGLGLSILAVLIVFEWQNLHKLELNFRIIQVLVVVGEGMLAILAGLLPAQRDGTIGASMIAGVVLALSTILAIGLHQNIMYPQEPFSTLYWGLDIGLVGLPVLVICLLAALTGGALYRRNARTVAPQPTLGK